MQEIEVEGLNVIYPLGFEVRINLMEVDNRTFDGTEIVVRVTLINPLARSKDDYIALMIKKRELLSYIGLKFNSPVYIKRGSKYITPRQES